MIGEAPVTTAYGGILIGTSLARRRWPEAMNRVVDDVSTNLENLDRHPIRALVGSAFFIDGSLPLHVPFGFVPLAISESRLGSKRTVAIFAVGHIGATLITAATIRRGIATGYYDPSVAESQDVGISYGGLTVRFAAIGALNSATGIRVDIARAGALLAITQPWQLPRDFTATGHTVAAAIGAIIGVGIRRQNRRRSSGS